MPADTPEIEPHDVYPHTPHPVDEPQKVVSEYFNHVQDRAHIADVLDAIKTLYDNGVEDEPRLIEFGQRMSSLIFHGGLTPSEAKARAAKDVIRTVGTSDAEVAETLGMTRGGFGSLRTDAGEKTVEARNLHYMTMFASPLNLVFSEHMAAEPPADYETRYVLLEVVDQRTEETVSQSYARDGPVEQRHPPEPQYALITEKYAADRGDWSADDPEDRRFGHFLGLDVAWYMDDDEVVDALYEETYFDTEERAEVWQSILQEHGFRTVSEPRERLNPDIMHDEV